MKKKCFSLGFCLWLVWCCPNASGMGGYGYDYGYGHGSHHGYGSHDYDYRYGHPQPYHWGDHHRPGYGPRSHYRRWDNRLRKATYTSQYITILPPVQGDFNRSLSIFSPLLIRWIMRKIGWNKLLRCRQAQHERKSQMVWTSYRSPWACRRANGRIGQQPVDMYPPFQSPFLPLKIVFKIIYDQLNFNCLMNLKLFENARPIKGREEWRIIPALPRRLR